MTDKELDVGMKVRLYGFEVWKVAQCYLDMRNGSMLWEIRRGACRKVVSASSLKPYRV